MHDARVIHIGILPTLRSEQFDAPWLSDGVRYKALNDSLLRERGYTGQIQTIGKGADEPINALLTEIKS